VPAGSRRNQHAAHGKTDSGREVEGREPGTSSSGAGYASTRPPTPDPRVPRVVCCLLPRGRRAARATRHQRVRALGVGRLGDHAHDRLGAARPHVHPAVPQESRSPSCVSRLGVGNAPPGLRRPRRASVGRSSCPGRSRTAVVIHHRRQRPPLLEQELQDERHAEAARRARGAAPAGSRRRSPRRPRAAAVAHAQCAFTRHRRAITGTPARHEATSSTTRSSTGGVPAGRARVARSTSLSRHREQRVVSPPPGPRRSTSAQPSTSVVYARPPHVGSADCCELASSSPGISPLARADAGKRRTGCMLMLVTCAHTRGTAGAAQDHRDPSPRRPSSAT
jgi:hypothetical protein